MALALRADAMRSELPPKRPEALDCAADSWIREEWGSGRGGSDSPIPAGSWGHVKALLV